MALPKPRSMLGDAEHSDKEVAEATLNKAAYVRRRSRAEARTALLPRDLLKTMSFAAAVEMLTRILIGELVPKTAKEAAEVAKIALEIGRREMGEGELAPESMSDDQRANKMEVAMGLIEAARQRALEDAAGRPVAVPDLPSEPS